MTSVSWLPECPSLPAGDFSSPTVRPVWDGVLLHYTAGGSGRKTAHWARGRIGRSWHFLGCRDGSFVQQVSLAHIAWHAGHSEWPHSDGETYSGANGYAVGIELANHGRLERVGDKFFYSLGGKRYPYQGATPEFATLTFDNRQSVEGWWEPYSERQIEGLIVLLSSLKAVGVPLRLFGHEDVAVPFGARKFDPGPLFPWERLQGAQKRRTRATRP